VTQGADRGRAYRIFSAALDQPAADREHFVREQTPDNEDLQRDVMALLAAATPDSGATEALLRGVVPPDRNLLGKVYGQFRLVDRIGAGGAGVVYRAERTDGVPQAVAVKLLRSAISADSSARFVGEAQLLARLEHAAIARLIDVGVTNGDGWMALELVRGRAIDAYCDAKALGVRDRVRLLVTVADAVATAHRSLVVHRDIKPSNVLVTEDGHPKLIDFGIASVLSDAAVAPDATPGAAGAFTPRYAAPEQVRGEPVTVATDVFGLGALAHRLLTGAPPYAHAASPLAYLSAVTTGDVTLPSEVAVAGLIDARIARTLKGDLDAILIKALQRDPQRRYASVQDLREDLQRYLDGRPVSARRATGAYRIGKFVRRHALAVGLGAVILVGVAGGGLLYVLQEHRLTLASRAAARRGEFLERVLRSANPHDGRRDITVAEVLDSAAATLDQSLGKEPLVEASMLGVLVDTNTALGRFDASLAASDRQLALLERHRGGDLAVARALIARGELLRAYGRYADGIPVLRRAVALLDPLPGVEADKAAALDELAMTLTNRAGEKEAEALFRRSIDIWDRVSGEDRVGIVAAMQNLAVLLANEGRNEESAALAEKAIAVQDQYLPSDHPDRIHLEQTRAMALLNLRRPAQAEPLLRDVLARSARVFGPAHPDTVVAQVQLGEVLIDLNRYAAAQEVLRPGAETLDRIQGPESRYATGAWSDYAIAACSDGKHAADGLEIARRIAAVRARTLAAGDWHLPASQANIGLCLEQLQRHAEAEPLLVKAAADLEASRGAGFSTTQLALKTLRDLYVRTGRRPDGDRIASKITD
jgi:tetratricopeptide (TPR) repeat protein